MTISTEMIDNIIHVLNKMFDYIHNQDVTFFVYANKDFPLSHIFLQGITSLKEKDRTFHIRCIEKINQYWFDSKLVVFTILLNNMNINDITYQYNDISQLYRTKKKREIFQIFLNCHYTNYREVMEAYLNAMQRVINKRF